MSSATLRKRSRPLPDFEGVETAQLEVQRDKRTRERSELFTRVRLISEEIAALTTELIRRRKLEEAERRKGGNEP